MVDVQAAVAAAVMACGELVVSPMKIAEHGKFAIYVQGGIDHDF